MRTRNIGTLLGLFLTLASPALAQSEATWYAGAGLGRLYTRFDPAYTFLLGGDPQQFSNRANGLQLDLIAGRRHRMNDRFSVGYQGTFNINRSEWSLSIPEEPAELRYSLPYAVIASAVPEVHLTGIVSVFGEVGGGLGRVSEVKTSPSSSAYQYEKWRATLAVGGGLRIKAGDRVDIFAQYRHARYSGFEYDTFDPAGVHIEHVKDAPLSNGFSIGFTTNF